MGVSKARSYDRAFELNKQRRLFWELEQVVLAGILAMFPERQRVSHLDFACGSGRILSFVQRLSAESVGIDISPDMVQLAKQKSPESQFIVGDITDVDLLGDRSFDLVTAFRFFPNAEADLREKVMHCLRKHLRPGGFLVFNNHKHSDSLVYRLARLLHRGGTDGMSMGETDRLISRNGLVLVKTYHIGVLPLTERRFFLPHSIGYAAERAAMMIPLNMRLSQNLIYVCTTHG